MLKEADAKRLFSIVIGGLIYAFFMNTFIVPMGMYSGGFMGIAQITRTVINNAFHIDTGSFDYAGIISMCMNIPSFLIARKVVGKRYMYRSMFGLVSITIFLSLIPIPRTPIIEDMLASALIGGAGCGLGGGLVLRNGASSGGMDLVGALLIYKYENINISFISNSVNVVVFGVMLFLFGPEKVIYSIIFSFVYPMIVDRTFSQNINVEIHIIVNKDDGQMQREVFSKLKRGITKWTAIGAYTATQKEILYVLVNKYELNRLVHIVKKYDPEALIVENVGVRITGPFEKRIE